MEQDERILTILAAVGDKSPGSIAEPFNSLMLDRIASLVDARREEISASFYDEPEIEELDLGEVDEDS